MRYRDIDQLWDAGLSEWLTAATAADTPPGLLDWLAVLGGDAVAAEVAANPCTSLPTRNWLARHSSAAVRESLALRPGG